MNHRKKKLPEDLVVIAEDLVPTADHLAAMHQEQAVIRREVPIHLDQMMHHEVTQVFQKTNQVAVAGIAEVGTVAADTAEEVVVMTAVVSVENRNPIAAVTVIELEEEEVIIREEAEALREQIAGTMKMTTKIK